jgi:hypothetical protein
MPQVGFEPTIPEFEREKAVHALDRAATVIGIDEISPKYIEIKGNETKIVKLKCNV